MWFLLAACGPGPLDPGDAGALPAATPGVYRFVAVGDVGHAGAVHERVARAAAETCRARGCDLVVLLGDNLYPVGLESETDPRMDAIVAPWRAIAPVALVLGNHDYGLRGRDEAAAERQVRWAARSAAILPGKAWTASAGPARIVAVDTNRVFWWGESEQVAWLRAQPEGTPWRVLLAHHPWRSEGRHGNAGAYEGWPAIPWMSGAAVARLYDQGVCGRFDLVISAHDHNLAHLAGPCGETLVVSGSGSSATSGVDRADVPIYAEAIPGYVWVELGATGTVAWLDETGAERHRARLTSRVRPTSE